MPGHRLTGLRAAALLAALLTATPGLADRSLDETPPEGLWLSAAVEAAWLAGDGHLGLNLGLGLELEDLRAHLRAPLYLRVLDLPPREGGAGACGVIRCADWLGDDGALEVARLSRLIDLVEAGDPTRDPLYLRLGGLFVTIGEGALVDRYLNSPVWDERQSGLYAHLNLEEELGARAEILLGGLFAPGALSAARLELQPGVWAGSTPLLRRARVGLGFAGDFGDAPLSGLSLNARWPLLAAESPWALEPRVALTGLYGLHPDGVSPSAPPGIGAGAHAGLELILRFPLVALRAEGRLGVDGPGHRPAPFSTLYEIERAAALSGGTAGYVSVPAPGGVSGALLVELRVLDRVSSGARVLLEQSAPGAGGLELFTEVAAGPARVSARVLSRDLNDPANPDQLWALADGSWRLWGPLAVYARYARSFRGGRFDDDLWLGVSANAVLE